MPSRKISKGLSWANFRNILIAGWLPPPSRPWKSVPSTIPIRIFLALMSSIRSEQPSRNSASPGSRSGFSISDFRFVGDCIAGLFRRARVCLSGPLKDENGHDGEDIDIGIGSRGHVCGESFHYKTDRCKEDKKRKLFFEIVGSSPTCSP